MGTLNMNGRKVALIIFYNHKKEILLQDRKQISRMGEEWGFFGGGIEKEEEPKDAVVREVKEELDFKLVNFKYIGNCKTIFDDGFILERYIFVSPAGELSKFTLKEGAGMQFFSLMEARKLKTVKGDTEVLDMITEYLESVKSSERRKKHGACE